MRAAKRRKAKKAAMRRYEEERMAALEMEAAAAAGLSKTEDDHKNAIQVPSVDLLLLWTTTGPTLPVYIDDISNSVYMSFLTAF
jgi:hypothetical protein